MERNNTMGSVRCSQTMGSTYSHSKLIRITYLNNLDCRRTWFAWFVCLFNDGTKRQQRTTTIAWMRDATEIETKYFLLSRKLSTIYASSSSCIQITKPKNTHTHMHIDTGSDSPFIWTSWFSHSIHESWAWPVIYWNVMMSSSSPSSPVCSAGKILCLIDVFIENGKMRTMDAAIDCGLKREMRRVSFHSVYYLECDERDSLVCVCVLACITMRYNMLQHCSNRQSATAKRRRKPKKNIDKKNPVKRLSFIFMNDILSNALKLLLNFIESFNPLHVWIARQKLREKIKRENEHTQNSSTRPLARTCL